MPATTTCTPFCVGPVLPAGYPSTTLDGYASDDIPLSMYVSIQIDDAAATVGAIGIMRLRPPVPGDGYQIRQPVFVFDIGHPSLCLLLRYVTRMCDQNGYYATLIVVSCEHPSVVDTVVSHLVHLHWTAQPVEDEGCCNRPTPTARGHRMVFQRVPLGGGGL
jgi:hypothetical protein